MSHKCVANVFCDVKLLRPIAMRCVDALSSTGFSLCTVDGLQLKRHRPARPAGGLKPVLPHRARPALVPLAEIPVGNFHRVLVRNAD